MKNKHVFIIVCILILLTLVLPACGGGNTATTTTKSTAVTTTSAKTTTPSSTKTTTPPTTSAAKGNSLIDILGLGANIHSIYFELTMTVTGEEPINMKVWQKNTKMREEMSMSGMTIALIFDTDAKIMYTYYPDQKMAMKATLDSSMLPDSPMKDTSGILDYSPIVIGTETIDGKVCEIIGYEESGQGSVKMWIWKDKGLPVKMEMTSGTKTTTIEYKNIDLSDIPDSMFEIPDDVTITSIGG